VNPLFFIALGLHLLGVVFAYLNSIVLVPMLARGGTPPAWSRRLVERVSLPAAISMPVTGGAMLVFAGINPLQHFWLWGSILLYAGSLVYLVYRQLPRVIRMARGDRSPELRAQSRVAGTALAVIIVVIGVMMMTKPG
jgi:uncharacterized membrane protein